MELFYRLAIDAGLVIFLVLSTIIGNILVCYASISIMGISLGLKSLPFHLTGFVGIVFIGIPFFCPVIATSYFCGNIAYNINYEFNYSDVISISASCFFCMFVFMGGLKILEDLEKSEESRKQGWTYQLWWERIDESLTPAVIITLFIMSGLILSCYFNGLN
jgi:hypothetical protein